MSRPKRIFAWVWNVLDSEKQLYTWLHALCEVVPKDGNLGDVFHA